MDQRSDRLGTGVLIGLLAGVFALLVSFLLSLRGFTFTPAAAGQAMIEVLPGWITVPLIELLKDWAKRGLVAGFVAVFLACASIAGVWSIDGRRDAKAVVAMALGPWLGALVAGILLTRQVDFAVTLVNAGLSSAALLAALAWLASSAGEVETSAPGRRRVLMIVAGVAALLAFGGGVLGPTARAAGIGLGNVPTIARRLKLRATSAAEDPAFAKLAGLSTRITPNEDFYTVDEALIKPRVDIAAWTLAVRGNVEAPFSLTYEELLDLEAVEQLHTLECISNPVGGPLISTALFTGVRVKDLLDRARPKAGSFEIVLRSVDDYSDSITLAKAMEPGTIIAYLMNGNTLPQDHGYPARALIPDIYGMKNVKWVSTIEVVTFDHKGYWQERGWSDVAIVNTNSRLDVPDRYRSLKGARKEVVLAGIAFAGARGISKVEVSFDKGATWQVADLEEPIGPLTWRRWATHWTPQSTGRHTIRLRSTDGSGRVESATKREAFPDGATGYDEIDIVVEN